MKYAKRVYMTDLLLENNASVQTGIAILRTNPLNVGSVSKFMNGVHIFRPRFF
jgi:hypothetical protein